VARSKTGGETLGAPPLFDDREPNIIRSVNSVTELNKHKVRQFVEAVWNQGHLELIDELVAADYLGRISCVETGIVGRAAVRQLVSSHRRAYPDLYIKIEDEIAEDDRVVTRWQAMATPRGPRADGFPSGRVRYCEGISITRLLAGKQVDNHTEYTSFPPVQASPPSRPVPSAPRPSWPQKPIS
jgi:predicted ester cyclase